MGRKTKQKIYTTYTAQNGLMGIETTNQQKTISIFTLSLVSDASVVALVLFCVEFSSYMFTFCKYIEHQLKFKLQKPKSKKLGKVYAENVHIRMHLVQIPENFYVYIHTLLKALSTGLSFSPSPSYRRLQVPVPFLFFPQSISFNSCKRVYVFQHHQQKIK